jgi:aminopeptidase C
MMQTYTVEYLQNVVGSEECNVKYLNVGVDDMKEMTRRMIEEEKVSLTSRTIEEWQQ